MSGLGLQRCFSPPTWLGITVYRVHFGTSWMPTEFSFVAAGSLARAIYRYIVIGPRVLLAEFRFSDSFYEILLSHIIIFYLPRCCPTGMRRVPPFKCCSLVSWPSRSRESLPMPILLPRLSRPGGDRQLTPPSSSLTSRPT